MSRVGPLKDGERKAIITADTANHDKYTEQIDRESAHELLANRSTAIGQVKEKVKKFGSLFGLGKG